MTLIVAPLKVKFTMMNIVTPFKGLLSRSYDTCRLIYLSGWRHYVSEELQQFVQGDNDVFSNEIAEFDEKQKKILPAQHVRIYSVM